MGRELFLYTVNLFVVYYSTKEIINNDNKADIIYWSVTGVINFISLINMIITICEI